MVKRGVLSMLPEPAKIAARMRVFAMLDAILEPRGRCFRWFPDEQRGEFAGTTGGFSVFCASRSKLITGFTPGARDVRDKLPAHVSTSTTPISFALWSEGKAWRGVPGPGANDGSDEALACFNPWFRNWASKHYQRPLGDEILPVWRETGPLTRAILEALDKEWDEEEVVAEATLLQWPMALGTKKKAAAKKKTATKKKATPKKKTAKKKAR